MKIGFGIVASVIGCTQGLTIDADDLRKPLEATDTASTATDVAAVIESAASSDDGDTHQDAKRLHNAGLVVIFLVLARWFNFD